MSSGATDADGLDVAIECEAEDWGLRIVRTGIDVGLWTLYPSIN